MIPYSGLFSWGAKFRYFRGSPERHDSPLDQTGSLADTVPRAILDEVNKEIKK